MVKNTKRAKKNDRIIYISDSDWNLDKNSTKNEEFFPKTWFSYSLYTKVFDLTEK